MLQLSPHFVFYFFQSNFRDLKKSAALCNLLLSQQQKTPQSLAGLVL